MVRLRPAATGSPVACKRRTGTIVLKPPGNVTRGLTSSIRDATLARENVKRPSRYRRLAGKRHITTLRSFAERRPSADISSRLSALSYVTGWPAAPTLRMFHVIPPEAPVPGWFNASASFRTDLFVR
jgi:hypothetical protein